MKALCASENTNGQEIIFDREAETAAQAALQRTAPL